MADYLELPGGSVWYDERGAGDPLVLVHGGAVDSRFFDHNVGPLAERFRVITTDLWGHGRTADRDGDLIGGGGGVSDEQVEQTVAFLTLELYRAIPDSELSVMPGTSHFLLQEKPAACNAILLDFLANDPVATVAPIRRAPAQPAG